MPKVNLWDTRVPFVSHLGKQNKKHKKPCQNCLSQVVQKQTNFLYPRTALLNLMKSLCDIVRPIKHYFSSLFSQSWGGHLFCFFFCLFFFLILYLIFLMFGGLFEFPAQEPMNMVMCGALSTMCTVMRNNNTGLSC